MFIITINWTLRNQNIPIRAKNNSISRYSRQGITNTIQMFIILTLIFKVLNKAISDVLTRPSVEQVRYMLSGKLGSLFFHNSSLSKNSKLQCLKKLVNVLVLQVL